MSAEHTPTPWSVFEAGKRYGIDADMGVSIVLFQANDERHGDGVLGRTKDEAHANAEFIVRAVNAHDDLVAAVKLVRSIIGEAAPEGFNPLVGDWAARLFLSQHDTHAALTKADAQS